MRRLCAHTRRNTVAYLALVVALGGSSYAAINLPPGSVGTPQLRNHSVTPAKLDPAAIGGSVRAWARIGGRGNVISSSGPVRVEHPPSSSDYLFRWRGKSFSPRCAALATVAPDQPGGFADAQTFGGDGARVKAFTAQGQSGPPADQPLSVAVIC